MASNPDNFKNWLPEFQKMAKAGEMGAASGTHEESSHLAKELVKLANSLGLNQVADATGDGKPGAFAKKIKTAISGGRDVDVIYVSLPRKLAQSRAVARAKNAASKGKVPRAVPGPELAKQHASVSANYEEVSKIRGIRSLKVFDNEGASPVLIASGGKGKMNIHDRGAMIRFKKKRTEKITKSKNGELKRKGKVIPDTPADHPEQPSMQESHDAAKMYAQIAEDQDDEESGIKKGTVAGYVNPRSGKQVPSYERGGSPQQGGDPAHKKPASKAHLLRLLRALGYQGGLAQATLKFQADHGFKQDATIGKQTYAKIRGKRSAQHASDRVTLGSR